jgi:L-asparaginase II
MNSQVLVHVERGGLLECCHRGHIAVVDFKGNIKAYAGDPEVVVFSRSTVKPMQTLTVLESGAARQFGLTDEELAVMSASHQGEDFHLKNVESILKKAGIDSNALLCGPHPPFHKETANQMKENKIEPTKLHNNCSGKHAGMLALCRFLNANLESYLALDHPVQQLMQRMIAELCGISPKQMSTGVDGCGVPVFAMPLHRLAYGMARLGQPSDLSPNRSQYCRRIVTSILQYPYHLAGSNSFGPSLITTVERRMIAKGGAEGMFAIILPDDGLGIVIKIEDGSGRAIPPAIIETLKQLDLITPTELAKLNHFHQPNNMNWVGIKVGEIRPVFKL